MIKKLLFLLPFSLFAISGTVELRAGYYYPESQLLRELYQSGGIEGELEASVQAYKDLSVFANSGVFSRSGHSIGLNTDTTAQIYPLSVGLKYNFHVRSAFDLYLGIAPTYTWAIFHDKSPYVKTNVHKNAAGVVGKAGALIHLSSRVFFDLFFDYYYTKLSGTHYSGVTATPIDIGGFRTGIGFGIKI